MPYVAVPSDGRAHPLRVSNLVFLVKTNLRHVWETYLVLVCAKQDSCQTLCHVPAHMWHQPSHVVAFLLESNPEMHWKMYMVLASANEEFRGQIFQQRRCNNVLCDKRCEMPCPPMHRPRMLCSIGPRTWWTFFH